MAQPKSTTSIVPVVGQMFGDWIPELNKNEVTNLQRCTNTLVKAMVDYGYSRLAIGRSLLEAQEILAPHGKFDAYLQYFSFSGRTAYRYIERAKNLAATLPDPILQQTFIRSGLGDDHMETYTAAMEKVPPPRSPTVASAAEWIEKVVEVQKEVEEEQREQRYAPGSATVSLKVDLDDLLKQSYILVRRCMTKLPTARAKASFLTRLTGMLMTTAAIAEPLTVKGVRVDATWERKRGRPRLDG